METRSYKVNLRNSYYTALSVGLSQYDTGVILDFEVYDGAEAAVFDSGTTAKIQGVRPSGIGFNADCTLSGNIVTVTTTTDMTGEYGTFPVELRFYSSGVDVGTINFNFAIEKAAHPDGTIDADITHEQDIVDKINQILIQTTPDTTLSKAGVAADSKTVGDNITELKNALDFTNNNLPWHQTYPVSIFSHGQVLYGSGEWSNTITRWGTKDLQYTDKNIYLSIKPYVPELIYQVCYFTQDGAYISWSGWQNKDSGEYKISAGSYYKITIARSSGSSDKATIDYIYQLVKNTKLEQVIEDTAVVTANKFKWVNRGIKFDPILVGGYTNQNVIRDSSTLDIRRRYKTMLKPKYIYAGSYVYCDTVRLYRMRVVKRETPESENGTIISDNIVIPTQESPYVFSDDGYYTIHFMTYDGASEVVLNDLYSHLTFGLYSDAPNFIFVDFIGGGRTFEGPADATLFIGEHGKSLLIDGVYQNMQGNLFNELHNMGVDHLDYVMISHYHSDHFAGLTILYEDNNLSPDNTTFILPSEAGVAYALEHLSADMSVDWYNRFMTVINNANCTVIHPKNDDLMDIGGMTVRFWNADHSIYEGVSTNYNDWSLCCYVTYGTQRICMTGDLGPIGERLNQGKMLKSNIYKAHHHGWDGMNADIDVMGMKRYMSEIMPDIIVALDGSAHDELYLQDTSPLIPWCESNAIPLYRAHEWSPIKIEVTKDSFVMLTTARRYVREEIVT